MPQIAPLTLSHVRAASKIGFDGPSTLVMTFPGDATLSYNAAGQAVHQTEILRVLSRVAGRPMHVKLVLAPATPRKVRDVAKPKSNRMQRMREIEAHPMTLAFIEHFGAEIMRVEQRRE